MKKSKMIIVNSKGEEIKDHQHNESSEKHIVRHLEKYSVSTVPISGVCKSPTFWGHYKENKSLVTLLVYLKKPKWISKKSFDEIVEHLFLNLPKGFEIKELATNAQAEAPEKAQEETV